MVKIKVVEVKLQNSQKRYQSATWDQGTKGERINRFTLIQTFLQLREQRLLIFLSSLQGHQCIVRLARQAS